MITNETLRLTEETVIFDNEEKQAVCQLMELTRMKSQPGDITKITKVDDWHVLLDDSLVSGENATTSLVCKGMSTGMVCQLLAKTLDGPLSEIYLADNSANQVKTNYRYAVHITTQFELLNELESNLEDHLLQTALYEQNEIGGSTVKFGQSRPDGETYKNRSATVIVGIRPTVLMLEMLANENPKLANNGSAPYKIRTARVDQVFYFTPYLEI